MKNISRRQFLAGAAGAAAAGTFAATRPGLLADAASTALAPLPLPSRSGIDHVIVLMMENRSFDHYLGWLPGADGRQAGLSYRDRRGQPHPTHHLTDFQNCAFADPDHSYDGGRTQYDGGRNDGFLRSGDNDAFAIGYYQQKDLAFYGQAVPRWTTFDRYFCPFMGPTFPNRFYQHAAKTDRITNTFDTSTLPTIWDRLAEKGLKGRYYYSDLPVLALWGGKYGPISHTFEQFLADCRTGNLPHVSFVDPRFIGEADGTSGDDHPFGDIRVGQYFLNQVYRAVTTSPAWPRTALIVNYDEWGGFYDHVPPTRTRDDDEDTDLDRDHGLRGFRVPCLLVSPRARRGWVSHRVYDHTSILKMIEWRWNLAPLTLRDATAHNIAEALDFSRPPNLSAPQFQVPNVVPEACTVPDLAELKAWHGLRERAQLEGWRVS